MGHSRQNSVLVSGLTLTVLLGAAGALMAERGGPSPQRARPPQWPADVLDTFFEDARETLVGARPDYGRAAEVARPEGPIEPPAGALASSGAAWSKLIGTETLEDEIKRLAQAVARDVTTPSEFKGGGFIECRRHFSVLAVLFAVTSEYDGEPRWQDVAPALRDLFARSGYNCKVGTDQTYQESLLRKQQLADLVRGSRPQVPQAEPTTDWGRVADRPPLMQRLETAHQERLTKWLADERQFARHRDDVLHEAQLMATLAEVIGREGFDYWDDFEYAQYAGELRDAAADIATAVEREDFDQARQAIGRATNACANCHDGYRG